jgi:hypothetical protein
MTNQTRIAAALGVTQATISTDVHAILNNWIVIDPAIARMRRMRRIKQLEELLQEALEGFDASKGDEHEPRVLKKPCVACAGAGADPDEPRCTRCKGRGYTTTATLRRTGRTGDPEYLRVARDCVVACARLEGLA